MRGKFFLKMMLALFLLPSVTANAAKIDSYRDAILSKNFTLKYTVEIPPIYHTNNDAFLGSEDMISKNSMNFYNTLYNGGIVVVDGDDRYTEIFHDDYTLTFAYKIPYGDKNSVKRDSHTIKKGGYCILIKDNEVFNFFWDLKDDQKRYYGSQGFFGKSKSVKANDTRYDVTPYQKFMRNYSFGLTELLPILPPDKILDLPGTPHYEFLGSGSLDNGLTYEDFVSDDSNMFSAVRYYFDGDDMKRISFAAYVKKDGEIEGYKKSIMDIIEFVPKADQSYLSLPEELKDKTKRDDKKDKEDNEE